jgi:hypothetical protein
VVPCSVSSGIHILASCRFLGEGLCMFCSRLRRPARGAPPSSLSGFSAWRSPHRC